MAGSRRSWHNPIMRTIEARFWAHVEPDGDCWAWTGPRTSAGYGTIELPGLRSAGLKRRVLQATHVALWLATGAWPVSQVNHVCDRPSCVQFGHLYEGTHAENMADMSRRGRAPHRKLTDAQAAEVRALCASGVLQREAAALYGVSQRTVWMIVHRKNYQHA